MAIGQKQIDFELLSFFESVKLSYDTPYAFNDASNSLRFINIQSSDIGRISVGRARLRLKEVDALLIPILKRNNVNIDDWRFTISEFDDWNPIYGNIKTDSIKQLQEGIKIIEDYFSSVVFPFWEEYCTLEKVAKVIESNSEKNLNQLIFQGVSGIMNRMIISKKVDSVYFKKNKRYYLDILKKQAQNKPDDYQSYYLAYKELVNELESTNMSAPQSPTT